MRKRWRDFLRGLKGRLLPRRILIIEGIDLREMSYTKGEFQIGGSVIRARTEWQWPWQR
jgi:hypothetical protein